MFGLSAHSLPVTYQRLFQGCCQRLPEKGALFIFCGWFPAGRLVTGLPVTSEGIEEGEASGCEGNDGDVVCGSFADSKDTREAWFNNPSSVAFVVAGGGNFDGISNGGDRGTCASADVRDGGFTVEADIKDGESQCPGFALCECSDCSLNGLEFVCFSAGGDSWAMGGWAMTG